MSEAEMTTTREGASPTDTFWIAVVWHSFRPYLIKFCVDLAIFFGIWGVLLAAHFLAKVLPLNSKLSEFLVGFHETMVVISFVWISLAAIWDLVSLKKKG